MARLLGRISLRPDARDVCVEGESGILSVHPKDFRPLYASEILDDVPGALWTRVTIDMARTPVTLPGMQRVVVAVDPSGAPEANQYSFDLVYDTWSTDEHEANGPGGSFFFIFALGASLFGGPTLGSKNIDLLNNYRLTPVGS
jgi:hypothetical protein